MEMARFRTLTPSTDPVAVVLGCLYTSIRNRRKFGAIANASAIADKKVISRPRIISAPEGRTFHPTQRAGAISTIGKGRRPRTIPQTPTKKNRHVVRTQSILPDPNPSATRRSARRLYAINCSDIAQRRHVEIYPRKRKNKHRVRRMGIHLLCK